MRGCSLSFTIIILCALIAAAATARAQQPLTTADVLAQHIKALGGEEAIRALKSSHLEYDVAIMQLRGTVKEYYLADGRYRVDFDSPIAKQTEGYNGWIEWTVEGESTLTTKDKPIPQGLPQVLPDFQYLFPSAAITVEYRGTDGEGDAAVHKLEVTQTGEEPRLLELDAKSFLVKRVRLREDNMNVTVTYSDYHPVSGVLMSHKQNQQVAIPGAPPFDYTLSLARFGEQFPNSLFDPPVDLIRDFEFANEGKAEDIPVSFIEGHLFTKVQINGGEPLDFIIDSGAGRTILAERIAKSLELPSHGEIATIGISGPENVSAVRIESLAMPGATLRNQTLFAMDLSALEPFLGRTIDGILGYDLFVRMVVKINYKAQTMSLYDPDSFLYEGTGERVQGKLVMNIFQIPGVIEDAWTGEVRVDTGSSGALHLHTPFLKNTNFSSKNRKYIEIEAMGGGGMSKLRRTLSKGVKIGSFSFTNVPTDLPIGDVGAFAVQESMGTIGNEILSRFSLYFNYSKTELILEQGDNIGQPFETDLSGLALKRQGTEYIVHQVYEKTAAAKAGIKAGDVLLSINAMPANGLTLPDIKSLLRSAPGTEVALSLLRGGKPVEVKIKLESYFN